MIEVKVRNKQNGNEQTLTYQAYKDVQYLFDLIGQVDSKGNLIEGDPNLAPQHQRKSASVIVADVGQREKPKFDSSLIPESLRAQFEEKRNQIDPPEISQEPEKISESVEQSSEPKPKRKYTKRKTEV